MTNQSSDALLEGGQAQLSLTSVISVLLKRKWMILAMLFALPTIVGAVISKQPKIYHATATIIIDSTVPQYLGQNFKDVVEMEANWWSAQEMLQTELRVLKSHSQALAVARALCDKPGTAERPSALARIVPGASCSEAGALDRAAPELQALVQVAPIKESRVVNLSVDFSDPELATVLANTMARVYVDRNLERRLAQSEGAATWLGDEYGDLSTQLHAAEQALIEFKRKNNVVAVAIEDQQNDLSTRRKKLSEELSSINIKLIAVKAMREQYALLQSDDPLETVPNGTGDSPVMQKLKELYVDQYAKLLELKGKYLEKHPTVIAQETRLQALRADLKREASLTAKAIEAQYQALVRQERDLRAALDGSTREALQLEQRAIEYNHLKRNFDRLAKLSEQVGGRERETSLAGHLKTNNVRVLDAARVPASPIAPNVPRAVSLAFLVALVIGIALAFLLEMLDSTVKSQDDVEHAAGLTFLGLIPRMTQMEKEPDVKSAPQLAELMRQGSRDLFVLSYPKSPVAECCRAIRTNLLFMSPDHPARTLLVSSAGPGEGKTTTAVSLAITLAQSGLRVLLVDTDMRKPRLHKAFGVPGTQDGLSRAIVGEAPVKAMVKETGIPNLFLLPCGAVPPNPAELLHTERFRAIVSELTAAYDRVIFDSPPIGAVTDAAILSRMTNGTILVAKGGQTSKHSLTMLGRRLLADGSINVLGCILNDLDLEKQGKYGYYYYSRYGYYGGYGDSGPVAPVAESGKSA